jgi:predicted nucleic acid-binding protein
MFTIDASVYVNALRPPEVGSADSQSFLGYVTDHSLPVVSPTLLLVELAAVLARGHDNASDSIALAWAMQAFPNYSWRPLNLELARTASVLAAQYRLRGADAVYAAVAQQESLVLVTLDRQQLERLSPLLKVQRPVEALHSLRRSRPSSTL